MKNKKNYFHIMLSLALLFMTEEVFGQSLSVKKQPSGNGPFLNMRITEAKAVGNLRGLCDFGSSKSVPCSDRADVHIHTSNNTITRYRYNGKLYDVGDLGTPTWCGFCDRVKITGVIKAGNKTISASKVTGPMSTGSYHLPFNIGASVPSKSISLVSLTIEPVSNSDYEKKLDRLAEQKNKQKKQAERKEAEQKQAKLQEQQKQAEQQKVAEQKQQSLAQQNTSSTTASSSGSNSPSYSRTSQNGGNASSSTRSSGPYKDPALNAKYAEAQREKRERIREMNRKINAMKAEQRRVERGTAQMKSGIDAMASGFANGSSGSNGLLPGSKQFIEGVARATKGNVGATVGAGALVAGLSILSSARKDKARREAAEREAEERRRIQEQREAERKRREAERERLRREAFALLISQRHTILETFSENEPIPLSTTHVESDTIYYFIYAYDPVTFEKKETTVYVSNVFAIPRYSDGTWPYQSKIDNETKDLTPYAEILQGYYMDAALAKEMQNEFVNGFHQNEGVRVADIAYREESMETQETNETTSGKADGGGLGIHLDNLSNTKAPAKSTEKAKQPNSLGIPLGSAPKPSSVEKAKKKEEKPKSLGIPIDM